MPPYEYDNMADSAGSAAQDAYTAVLDSGGSPAEALSAATEAAGAVMTDMGADSGMVDTMVTSATEGFTSAMEANPSMDPMEAFDAAGTSVDSAFEAEYGPMDGPPTGMDGPSSMTDMGPADMPPPGTEGDMPPPGDMAGPADMPPGDMAGPAIDPDTGMAPQPPEGPGDMAGPADMPPGDMAGPAIDPATGMAPQPPEGPGEGGYDDGPAPMDYPPGDMAGPGDMPPPGGDPASVGEPGGPEFGPATPPPEMGPDMPPTDPMMAASGPDDGGLDDGPAPVDYPPEMDEASSYMDQSSAEAMPEPGYDPASVDQPDVPAGDAAIPDPSTDDDTSGMA